MKTSLGGGNAASSSASLFGRFASTAWPLIRLSLRWCNQLFRLCREKGFFLGKFGIATTDLLWQESVLLTVMKSPERNAM